MTEQERELDLALADAMQENAQLRAKVADYEGLIRDLTDALRGQPDRNTVIEEVAEEIEKFHPAFGQDTVYSFAIFVRGMKK
jgi:hypothetical protein